MQVSVTEATMPAAAIAVAKSDPGPPPVKASPPPALTPAAVATASQDVDGSWKSGAKVPSAQQEGKRLSGGQQKRMSPSDPSTAREKRQRVEGAPPASLAGSVSKREELQKPGSSREERQKPGASQEEQRQKPGAQPSSSLAGLAADQAMRGSATGEEPGPAQAAEPPPAKRPKLNLASLLAGKVADGSPAALRDPRALPQPAAGA